MKRKKKPVDESAEFIKNSARLGAGKTSTVVCPWLTIAYDGHSWAVPFVPNVIDPERQTPIDGFFENPLPAAVILPKFNENGKITNPDNPNQTIMHHAYRVACEVLETHDDYRHLIPPPDIDDPEDLGSGICSRLTEDQPEYDGNLDVYRESVMVMEEIYKLRFANCPQADEEERRRSTDKVVAAFTAGFHFARLLTHGEGEWLAEIGKKPGFGGEKGAKETNARHRELWPELQAFVDMEAERDPSASWPELQRRAIRKFKLKTTRTIRNRCKNPLKQ